MILLGNKQVISKKSIELGLKNVEKAQIVDPKNHEQKEFYTDMLYNLRKNKGMTLEQAAKLVEDPLYLGVLLIKNKVADGEVAGALNATGDVLRPAFQIVKTLSGCKRSIRRIYHGYERQTMGR